MELHILYLIHFKLPDFVFFYLFYEMSSPSEKDRSLEPRSGMQVSK